MADRADRNRWLLNAEDACPDDVDAQIAWLRGKRAKYAEAADAGDWETQHLTSDGGSSTSRRRKTDAENHDAIVDALRYLGATDLGSTGTLLQVNFYPGVG